MINLRRHILVALLMSGLAATVSAAPSLTVGVSTGLAGGTVDLPITFNSGGSTIVAFQFDLILPSSVSPVTVLVGSPLNTAVKSVATNVISGNIWRFVIFPSTTSLNQNSISSGISLTARLAILSTATPGTALAISISTTTATPAAPAPSQPVYADNNANSIAGGTVTNGSITVYSPCDVNQSGGVANVGDVQTEVNAILNTIPQTPSQDLNGNGIPDVGDVQRIVNVILGGACVVGP